MIFVLMMVGDGDGGVVVEVVVVVVGLCWRFVQNTQPPQKKKKECCPCFSLRFFYAPCETHETKHMSELLPRVFFCDT